jgi:hypothetical protein
MTNVSNKDKDVSHVTTRKSCNLTSAATHPPVGERGAANAQCEPCSHKVQLSGLVTQTSMWRFVSALG